MHLLKRIIQKGAHVLQPQKGKVFQREWPQIVHTYCLQ